MFDKAIDACKIREQGEQGLVAGCWLCTKREACLASVGAADMPRQFAGAKEADLNERTRGVLSHLQACLAEGVWGIDVLVGDYGVGKSHASAAITKVLGQDRYTSRWLSWRQVDVELKRVYSSHGCVADWMQPYIDVDLLVLDGFGDHLTVRAHALDAIDSIVLSRYDANKPMLVTTNLDPEGFRTSLPAATIDRIRQNGKIVHIAGTSRRKMAGEVSGDYAVVVR